MYHASDYIANVESDDDDYVSMDEEEAEMGIQAALERRESLSLEADELENDDSEPVTLMGLSSMSAPMQAYPTQQVVLQPQQQQQPQPVRNGFLSSLSSLGNLLRRNNANSNEEERREVVQESAVEEREDRRVEAASSALSSLNRRKAKKKNRKIVRRQKVNTNVVAVDLSTLGDKAKAIATGDPFRCKNDKCRVFLSHLDELTVEDKDKEEKVDDDEKLWICQFCGTRNVIEIDEEEKPTADSIDYIIEPPSDEKSKEENRVVFCIDVSGSMCVTTEYEGKIKLRGTEDLSAIRAFNEDASDQYFPGQKRNTTYVSRLQSVQAAVDDQISDLVKSKGMYRVGLVTFSDEVTIFGDGTTNPEFIAGDKLKNIAALRDIGSKYELKDPIEKSEKAIKDKLYSLREKGQTALGPALVSSVAIGSRNEGSQVILCTDGLANVGLGSLDELTEEEQDAVEEWYEDIANWALSKGVVVNVISITDSECRLENVGKVADITQGTLERIDPKELASNFKGILEKKVLATKTQATMLLHPLLRFKTDQEEMDLKPISEESSDVEVQREIQDVGNVFDDSKLYFEYCIRKKRRDEYKDLKQVVFQVQIEYTRSDGAKMLRVITQTKEVTNSRKQVLENLNMDVMAANASRKSARLCEEGDYEAARVLTYSNAMWMNKNAQNYTQQQQMTSYLTSNFDMDVRMQTEQRTEASSGIRYGSKKEKKKARSRRRKDDFSKAMYYSKRS